MLNKTHHTIEKSSLTNVSAARLHRFMLLFTHQFIIVGDPAIRLIRIHVQFQCFFNALFSKIFENQDAIVKIKDLLLYITICLRISNVKLKFINDRSKKKFIDHITLKLMTDFINFVFCYHILTEEFKSKFEIEK